MSVIDKWISTINEVFGARLVWIVSAAIDGAFLVLWVAVQFRVNYYIAKMELSGPDRLVFAIFQWGLFPIATLAPIAIWIYQDIRVMIVRAQHKIEDERKKK